MTPTRRTDWWFSAVRFGVEYQGSVDHGTLAGRAVDVQRDAELRRENIRLISVTKADATTLVATVGAALAARAYELGVAAPRLRAG